jgi:ATP-dependent DNA helicase RecG
MRPYDCDKSIGDARRSFNRGSGRLDVGNQVTELAGRKRPVDDDFKRGFQPGEEPFGLGRIGDDGKRRELACRQGNEGERWSKWFGNGEAIGRPEVGECTESLPHCRCHCEPSLRYGFVAGRRCLRSQSLRKVYPKYTHVEGMLCGGMDTLSNLLLRLRMDGSESADMEVKRAAGGFPESVVPTLCAFANRPGGGTVLLGVDEAIGFATVPVDAPALARRIADVVRQRLDPPPSIAVSIEECEGNPVVVASVEELAIGVKPCRIRSGVQQGVWIRAFDGDYRASDVEVQAFFAARVAPTHDRAPVEGATMRHLDHDLVAGFLASRRAALNPSGRAAGKNDADLLEASSVMIGNQPTVAGLLMLGTFPQQFFPGLHLRAVFRPGDSDPLERAADAPRLEGPISEIMTSAVRWVSQMTPTAIVGTGRGGVVDRPTWPLDAIRELVGNALLHRDLSWSVNEPVMLNLSNDSLVVRSPGGLYGVSVEELGRRGVTPARNATMMAIATHVRMPEGQNRAVEQLATGIPTVRADFAQRGFPEPRFTDDAVRFTAVGLRSEPAPHRRLGDAPTRVLEALGNDRRDVNELATALGRSKQVVRRDLNELAADGLVLIDGGQGRRTTYRRSDG